MHLTPKRREDKATALILGSIESKMGEVEKLLDEFSDSIEFICSVLEKLNEDSNEFQRLYSAVLQFQSAFDKLVIEHDTVYSEFECLLSGANIKVDREKRTILIDTKKDNGKFDANLALLKQSAARHYHHYETLKADYEKLKQQFNPYRPN
jgi:hypothetical protein